MSEQAVPTPETVPAGNRVTVQEDGKEPVTYDYSVPGEKEAYFAWIREQEAKLGELPEGIEQASALDKE